MDNSIAVHSLEVFGVPGDAWVLAIPKIESEQYFSLSFDYEFSERFDMYAGVRNLTDNKPPQYAGSSRQSNTDPSLYDVYGRRYFVGLSARF